MDLLTVPEVNTQLEFRPLTLEEMEDVGKRYRERKRRHKVPAHSQRAQGLGPRQAGVQGPALAQHACQLGDAWRVFTSLSPIPHLYNLYNKNYTSATRCLQR
jgi:hypothetical protein